MAFKNSTAPGATVHQDAKVQFASSPGSALAYDNQTSMAEVRWATAKGPTNVDVSGASLEPIARKLLIPK